MLLVRRLRWRELGTDKGLVVRGGVAGGDDVLGHVPDRHPERNGGPLGEVRESGGDLLGADHHRCGDAATCEQGLVGVVGQAVCAHVVQGARADRPWLGERDTYPLRILTGRDRPWLVRNLDLLGRRHSRVSQKSEPTNLGAPRACSIADALEVVGERWSLLVLRELGLGVSRFKDIQVNTGAPRETLALRLRTLEEAGLIERRRYRDHPPRDDYLLTAAGQDLTPVLTALRQWGEHHATPVRHDGPRCLPQSESDT